MKQQKEISEKKIYDKDDIYRNINSLIKMHADGDLGGEVMPEDAMPENILIGSFENHHFLTLPMSLNYQRNSYTLWKSARDSYLDDECINIFIPEEVVKMGRERLREKLLKYKLALQPNKHIDTWFRICETLCKCYEGDIRNVFIYNNFDVSEIKNDLQIKNKKGFPYLSGEKICNYWLYVIGEYTGTNLSGRDNITVAPDTHIIQSTIQLGLSDKTVEELMKNRTVVSDIWSKLLSNTDIEPIDIHTPLWLWSKANFPVINI